MGACSSKNGLGSDQRKVEMRAQVIGEFETSRQEDAVTIANLKEKLDAAEERLECSVALRALKAGLENVSVEVGAADDRASGALQQRVDELERQNREMERQSKEMEQQNKEMKQEIQWAASAPGMLGNSLTEAAASKRKRAAGLLVTDGQHTSSGGASPKLQQSEPKREEEVKWIMDLLPKKAPFTSMPVEQLRRVALAMRRVTIEKGVDVIKEGEMGEIAYLLEKGALEVVSADGAAKKAISIGEVFGEVSLIYNVPRTATIRATQPSSCWALEQYEFQTSVQQVAINERRRIFEFLRSIEIFSALPTFQISKIVDVVENESFPAGATILKQGDVGASMYVILSGEAVVSEAVLVEGESNDQAAEEPILRRILNQGDYLGERSLLLKEPRSATVTAVSDVEAVRIDTDTFVTLLPPLHASLSQKFQEYKELSLASQRVSQISPRKPVRPTAHVAFSELQPLKMLGKGGFGRVVMVKRQTTRQRFALKCITKATLLTGNAAKRVEWIIQEKEILAELDHPFIVRLYESYSEDHQVCILLSIALGGDMFRLIDKMGTMSEPVARFYSGSIVLAMQYLQELSIVYRDLKPENVLLDAQGYIKLCDFGFAKVLTEDRTYSRCGTPDYTSPEMLLNSGVNHASDWWAVGVITGEMLTGMPVFSDPGGDVMATYQNIIHGEILWASDKKLKPMAKKLISDFCTVKVWLGPMHASALVVFPPGVPVGCAIGVGVCLGLAYAPPPPGSPLPSTRPPCHSPCRGHRLRHKAPWAHLYCAGPARWHYVWATCAAAAPMSSSTNGLRGSIGMHWST